MKAYKTLIEPTSPINILLDLRKTMEDWSLNIKNEQLDKIYGDYLYSQASVIKFYISTVGLAKYIKFDPDIFDVPIRASFNFNESATAIQTIGEINSEIQSGDYVQLSRSLAMQSMVHNFDDIFLELKKHLDLDDQEIKKPFITKQSITIRPSALKIAKHIDTKYDLNSLLAEDYSMCWINSIINLRHMFIHERGLFLEDYRKDMFGKWTGLNSRDRIEFNENDIDSIYWYFNDHVKNFIYKLSEKI